MSIKDDPTALTAPAGVPRLDVWKALSQPVGAAGSPAPARSGRHKQAQGYPARFLVFGTIGGGIFVAGLALQALLTGDLGLPALTSYIAQSIASIEASFVLNRWLTWPDRETPFWAALWRFNVQKTVTVGLNFALYAVLLRLGMNYLLANVALTAVFTVVNFVAGDRFVFKSASNAAESVPVAGTQVLAAADRCRTPRISVVIPCRDNQRTIRTAVLSLLDQDYPLLHEILLIGSPGDRTWESLADILDPKVTVLEVKTPPGLRDANYKRDFGIRKTTGDLVALVDSDIELPREWLRRAVSALAASGAQCVTGGMRSVHDSFWGRYTDCSIIGAKTPRISESYLVTSDSFGMAGRKPPITANALFTRGLYDACPIDSSWSHGSYEDYEWFWRVTKAGYGIYVSRGLYGCHHHRRGWRALAREYRRSARGCAYFIRSHRQSPFARHRLRQAIVLPVVAVGTLTGAGTATIWGYGAALTAMTAGALAVMCIYQMIRARRLEGALYPCVGLALGLVFTMGLVTTLVRPTAVPAALAAEGGAADALHRRRHLRRIWHPLTAILALQAALSLSVVWSNTAFEDEAYYLWGGRLEILHWLHGTTVPVRLAHVYSGSPLIYPPLGAAASSLGGLAAARILSLFFMLGSTAFLYAVALRLFGRTPAVLSAALWVATEPVLRLGAFATYDAMSVFFTTLAAWLIMQAGMRRYRGEMVAAGGVSLAIANATAYSGVVIDPVVIIFAFLAWCPVMGSKQARFCTAWFTAALVLFFCGLMTISQSWSGIVYTVFARQADKLHSNDTMWRVLESAWTYAGFFFVATAVGLAVTVGLAGRSQRLMPALLAGAFLVVPVAQVHDKTIVSLDKHLAYGMWFSAIIGGYGLSRLIANLPIGKIALTGLAGLTLLFPAASAWQSTWYEFQGWANVGPFISAFKPISARAGGPIFVAGNAHTAEYYTTEGNSWQRWTVDSLQLDPPMPRSQWETFYANKLRQANCGVIVLFFGTNFAAPRMPGNVLLSAQGSQTHQELLNLVAANMLGEPGLAALTSAVEGDPVYRLTAEGPFDSRSSYGIYAIWQKR